MSLLVGWVVTLISRGPTYEMSAPVRQRNARSLLTRFVVQGRRRSMRAAGLRNGCLKGCARSAASANALFIRYAAGVTTRAPLPASARLGEGSPPAAARGRRQIRASAMPSSKSWWIMVVVVEGTVLLSGAVEVYANHGYVILGSVEWPQLADWDTSLAACADAHHVAIKTRGQFGHTRVSFWSGAMPLLGELVFDGDLDLEDNRICVADLEYINQWIGRTRQGGQ
jgi:hypothetical protein